MRDAQGTINVPLIGPRRAKVLERVGIKSISKLAKTDPARLASLSEVKACDGAFPAQCPLIVNFARALRAGKPIVTRVDQFILSPPKSVYFLDLEYDPNTPVFLYGIMDSTGRARQNFLDHLTDEKRLVRDFADWINVENPTFITYASKAADEPVLRKALEKSAIPTDTLGNATFHDLYYDVIFPASVKRQKIFLPVKPMTEKTVSDYFGYQEPPDLSIHEGHEALYAYKEYLKKREKRLRSQLLLYNRCDLQRIRLIFNKLSEILTQASSTKNSEI